MAIADLDILRDQLPEVYEDKNLPEHWEEIWEVIHIDTPEEMNPEQLFENDDYVVPDSGSPISRDGELSFDIPEFPEDTNYPGGLRKNWAKDSYPPPDALAFYLPFHFFQHNNQWGIYLVLEGTDWLASLLRKLSKNAISIPESREIAKIFLYSHEVFHHQCESFAMRLEVTHRKVLYKDEIWKNYVTTFNTDDCLEEALANAYGYRKVKEKVFKKNKKKKLVALKALEQYIRNSGPGYRLGMNYVDDEMYLSGRNNHAELNHNKSLPAIPSKNPAIWLNSPHVFRGFSQINSKANYLVRRDSPLKRRWGLW